MKSLRIHGPLDLRIENYHVDNLGANQVEIHIAIGGICGTDLHYYKHGGFGQIKLREPMILGHEVSGFISKIGSNVENLSIGQLVSVSPSRPCNKCNFCLNGNQIQCMNMKFYGSAMPFPHIQGAFREILIVEDYQCVPADGLSSCYKTSRKDYRKKNFSYWIWTYRYIMRGSCQKSRSRRDNSYRYFFKCSDVFRFCWCRQSFKCPRRT